jgi:superfamily I DNA/RNA helicase
MNSGTIKISTINSFKGWESEVVFLIIEPLYDRTTSFNMSFDELLYTGLTRCKRNLIIVNFGNAEYDKKMRPLIERMK